MNSSLMKRSGFITQLGVGLLMLDLKAHAEPSSAERHEELLGLSAAEIQILTASLRSCGLVALKWNNLGLNLKMQPQFEARMIDFRSHPIAFCHLRADTVLYGADLTVSNSSFLSNGNRSTIATLSKRTHLDQAQLDAVARITDLAGTMVSKVQRKFNDMEEAYERLAEAAEDVVIIELMVKDNYKCLFDPFTSDTARISEIALTNWEVSWIGTEI